MPSWSKCTICTLYNSTRNVQYLLLRRVQGSTGPGPIGPISWSGPMRRKPSSPPSLRSSGSGWGLR
jgi:hypothetical protein